MSCGDGKGVPVSVLRPGQALAGVVTGCNTPGEPGRLTIVATSEDTPASAPAFVAGVSPIPPEQNLFNSGFAAG